MKETICHYLSGVMEEVSEKEFLDMVETPPDEEMGDLALPCFGLAKKLHRNPEIIAAEIAEKLNAQKDTLRHDLYNQRIKNIDFSWNDVLGFEGSTGPYVQYTYARAKSVLRKYGGSVDFDQVDCNMLIDHVSYHLIKLLGGYEDAVKNAAEKYEPSVVARYVMNLAVAFNKFYHDCAILKAEEPVKQARLALTDLTQRVLQDGCGLLGLACPEEM